jgi:2',3'-cyclic-nucleotide 2'-phosphodiesterase (5'-nucleotidase family)
MTISRIMALLLAWVAGVALAAGDGERTATLLTVNDVYRIDGTNEGSNGGIPRLRTLRAELERGAPDLLLLHAGDILYPSMLSRRYDGAQMIDLLNRLDGDAQAFDERMVATFGNHEFDKDKASDAGSLQARLRESQFRWLDSNIRFARGEDGIPLVSAPNLLETHLIEVGGIRLGLFSATTEVKHPEYVASFADPVQTARRLTAQLRAQGAEVVVALTHLRASRDLDLLRTLGDAGPDLIIGGHEHDRQVHSGGGHRLVIKSDADARTAAVVKIHLAADGTKRIEYEYHFLDEGMTPAPTLQTVVDDWQRRFDAETCAAQEEAAGCLSSPLGHTQVELVGEELAIRRFETNLGDWVSDQALAAFADRGAQIAFVNSGGLRLNENLPADTAINRGHLLSLFAYPSPLVLMELDGATLQRVVDHAVEDWTGSGRWLQIAGFAFRHDPEQGRAYDLTLLTPQGPRPIRPDERLLAVTNDFLMNPAKGQDGYRMLVPKLLRTRPEAGPDLRDLVAEALRAAGEAGIAPQVEGRICNVQREGPCLAQP